MGEKRKLMQHQSSRTDRQTLEVGPVPYVPSVLRCAGVALRRIAMPTDTELHKACHQGNLNEVRSPYP